MEIHDLEAKVREAAKEVQRSGEECREAKNALHRAIMRHRAPGEIEELEIEAMAAQAEFDGALRAHMRAAFALSFARSEATFMEVA